MRCEWVEHLTLDETVAPGYGEFLDFVWDYRPAHGDDAVQKRGTRTLCHALGGAIHLPPSHWETRETPWAHWTARWRW